MTAVVVIETIARFGANVARSSVKVGAARHEAGADIASIRAIPA